jgi:hypothetical protein
METIDLLHTSSSGSLPCKPPSMPTWLRQPLSGAPSDDQDTGHAVAAASLPMSTTALQRGRLLFERRQQ